MFAPYGGSSIVRNIRSSISFYLYFIKEHEALKLKEATELEI